MKQLSIFEPLPPNIIQQEWEKEYIKNPPPIVSDEQRKQAQEKLNQYSSLRTTVSSSIVENSKLNLS